MIGYIQSNEGSLGAGSPMWTSDRTLLRSIAHGDKVALKVLYLRHCLRIHRFVLRLTGVESLADEVVNDVFLAVWRRAGQFAGESEVATWLLGIARFKAITACRRLRTRYSTHPPRQR